MTLCAEHYQQFVDTQWQRFKSMDLIRPCPSCFDEADWKTYQVMWFLSKKVETGASSPAHPCTDCTPETRDRMHKNNRCDHPETVFVMSVKNGVKEMVGINGDQKSWNRALMGLAGRVVSQPNRSVRDKFMTEQLNANKKNGR